MVYHIQNYWVFGLSSLSGILGIRKHNVRKLDLFPSSGVGGRRRQLGPIDRVNLNHWTMPVIFTQLFNHLRPCKFSGR
jgi:hypothetical protein